MSGFAGMDQTNMIISIIWVVSVPIVLVTAGNCAKIQCRVQPLPTADYSTEQLARASDIVDPIHTQTAAKDTSAILCQVFAPFAAFLNTHF